MPLKRVITLKEAMAINIGAIIGAGIFAISGLAAGLAGPSTIIAILIAATIAMLTGLSFARLASVYSEEGGSYIYARNLLGRYSGIISALMFFISSIIGGAAVALSFGSYFASLFGAAFAVPAIAIVLIIILGIVNYFGVKHSANASLILTIIKVGILAIFVIIGVFYIKPSNYTPFLPEGFGGLLASSAFIFFAYTGLARITALGEEVKNPKETIPKTILYSVLLSSLIYVLVMVVMIGIVPYKMLATSQSPLQLAIQYATHNALIGYVISIGALFATVNVVLSMVLGISRVTFAMSRKGDLPKTFAKINKFGVPGIAVFGSIVIMILSVVLLNFKQIVALADAAALLGYSIANVAAIKLVLESKGGKTFFNSRSFIAVPIISIACTIALIFFLPAISIYMMFGAFVIITLSYVLLTSAPRQFH